MRRSLWCSSAIGAVALLLAAVPGFAQTPSGVIAGRVTDSAGAVLVGARIALQPRIATAVSDRAGQFRMADIPPGRYTLTVSYVGFTPFSRAVGVAAGQTATVNAVLAVQRVHQQVTVTAPRQFGELEALNRERTADNIVQVLPALVINSLPNVNIADAVGRMPSVSLERDEGEGKYIQIRGTEPRLTNVTIDGIHVPGPEDVRNVKLDVIPADLVGSVELNKTLSANQDADAIGGSVNLVLKQATNRPYYSFGALGGYNPIDNGRGSEEVDGTVGRRFGARQRFGAMFSGSYDHNSRGINDLEPSPSANQLPDGTFAFGPSSLDERDYLFDRTRYGFGGNFDYQLRNMSSLYFNYLFSQFHDYGEAYISTSNAGSFLTPSTTDNTGSMQFSDVNHLPRQRIFTTQAGGTQIFGSSVLTYEAALSQARGFSDFPDFVFAGPADVAFNIDTSQPYTPKFNVANGVKIYDPSAYTVSRGRLQQRRNFERDEELASSWLQQYSTGSHYGTAQFGIKWWDGRKTENFDLRRIGVNSSTISMAQFLSPYTNQNYYQGDYTWPPVTDYSKIFAFYNQNPSLFTTSYDPISSLPNDFDIEERVFAAYGMNTISFGRLRLQAGVRMEHTGDHLQGNVVTLDSNGNFSSVAPLVARHGYTNVFPSLQAKWTFNSDTDLRASYGMGIARPDFGDLAPSVTDDPTSFPPVSAGNPNLLPTHAQNFDLLAERYLRPVGLIQGGIFYKYLTNPIFFVTMTRTAQPFAGSLETAPVNGPKASLGGIELSWQQQLRFLPGALAGTGVSANYSYTASRATFPSGFGREDHPLLQRDAPNNWNLDGTYDRVGISARVGVSHNDTYIWAYNFLDGAPGGLLGPLGDLYIYPHTQVDAEASYLIPGGRGTRVVFSILDLNNDAFGFYNGSAKYPAQREYYRPTFSIGLRWTNVAEAK